MTVNINRRVFLKSSGLSLLGFSALPPFLQRLALSNPSGNKKILVTVFQRGAADGLNVVASFGEKLYYRLRPSIAIPQPSARDGESLIDLDGFFGLHPSLRSLKPLYDQKHLAVLHAVGSPDSTRSHFDAQDFMETGTPASRAHATAGSTATFKAKEIRTRPRSEPLQWLHAAQNSAGPGSGPCVEPTE
jgi:uncharacterized protein (DUF1501 family)